MCHTVNVNVVGFATAEYEKKEVLLSVELRSLM